MRPEEKLYAAVHQKNVERATQLLDDMSQEFKEGLDRISLLKVALENNQIEMLKLFVRHGIRLNQSINEYGMRPLHYAAQSGNYEMLQFLIDYGADVDVKDSSYSTPLVYAIYHADLKAVTLLVESGSDIQLKTLDEKSILSYATERAERTLRAGNVNDNSVKILQYLKEAIKNPEKYRLSPIAKIRKHIYGRDVNYVKELPRNNPEVFENIMKFGILHEMFKQLPYREQLSLYKITTNRMTPNEKKIIENIIRNVRIRQQNM